MGIHSVNDIGFENALGPRLKALKTLGHIDVSDELTYVMLVTSLRCLLEAKD